MDQVELWVKVPGTGTFVFAGASPAMDCPLTTRLANPVLRSLNTRWPFLRTAWTWAFTESAVMTPPRSRMADAFATAFADADERRTTPDV